MLNMVVKVVSICSQKGGTGKTTTAVNLGAALVDRRRKVLLVDIDPQASLTIALGLDTAELTETVYDAVSGKSPMRFCEGRWSP